LKGFLDLVSTGQLIEARSSNAGDPDGLGDPDFVNVTSDVAEMLLLPFADRMQ
jgi:hypothetical protein